jgi:hypothetical protein
MRSRMRVCIVCITKRGEFCYKEIAPSVPGNGTEQTLKCLISRRIPKKIRGWNACSGKVNQREDATWELLALSVSVAVLGGVWAFIALSPIAGYALVWVGFIAAGCFFAAGGDAKALTKTIVGMIYGAVIAWIALMIIAKVPIPALGTVWPAIVVGVTVFFLVIVASIDLLSCVPANVYGYAALVGYTLSAGKLDALTAADNSNPLFLVVVSTILGGVFGYLMGQLAGLLKTNLVKQPN